ncbi:MAG TPA: aspartate aminotransferase family protein [Gaiellales bacterium]|nr:aspartate aminotransferase family protein [Gaiellales bacterium]
MASSPPIQTDLLHDRARGVIPGGVNSGQRCIPGIEDLVITETSGSRIRDQHGNWYTDYHAAFGPPVLGHNDPDVDAAVAETIRKVSLPGVGITPVEIELAERLVQVVPSLETVLLTSSGSEATYHAVRLSRAITGRRRLVKFQGCYHGWHDAVAMNVISAPDRVGGRDPLSKGSLQEATDATDVLPFNDAAAVEELFALRGQEIAAVIVEPIPHNVGALLPKDGFLEMLRELCTAHGSVLIFDEVITGFRHDLGGYQAICGVTPDLTTLGKAMANGYPIGALGGRRDLMESFSTTPGRPVFFAGTYNGHPAMAAAALATISKLEREPVHEHLFGLGEAVRVGLREALGTVNVPHVVTGFGSVWVTYFMDAPADTYSDLLRNDVELFVGYRHELRKHGIFELPLNLKRNHMSYAHTRRDAERVIEATAICVERVIAASA